MQNPTENPIASNGQVDTPFDDSLLRKNHRVLSEAEIKFVKMPELFKTALEEAAFEKDLQKCFDLLTCKPSLMVTRNFQGYTPLHDAIFSNNFELLRLMLSNFTKFINIKSHTEMGGAPLHSAVMLRAVDAVHLLLARGADVNACTSTGEKALHLAVGSLEISKLLVAQGANVDMMDNEGYTPLQRAIAGGYPETAQFLFDAGADIEETTLANESVFDLIPADNAAAFAFLRAERKTVTLPTKRSRPTDLFFHSAAPVPEYQNALVEACRNADLGAVKELVQRHNANPLMPDQKGRYALSEAIWHLAADVVSWLLDNQNPAYTTGDISKMLMSTKGIYDVDTVLPLSSPMKTFHDWRLHFNKNHAPWFYNYEQVKKRETLQCPVQWGTEKHATCAALPLAAKENHPFVKLEFTDGGRFVVRRTEVYRDNEIASYPEYKSQIEWLLNMCMHLKNLLNTHGIILSNDYVLEKIEVPVSLNLLGK